MKLEYVAHRAIEIVKKRDAMDSKLVGLENENARLKAENATLSSSTLLAEVHWLKEEVKAYYSLKGRLGELEKEYIARAHDLAQHYGDIDQMIDKRVADRMRSLKTQLDAQKQIAAGLKEQIINSEASLLLLEEASAAKETILNDEIAMLKRKLKARRSQPGHQRRTVEQRKSTSGISVHLL